MFTGDRSGDFLFAALHRTGFAASPDCRVISDDPGLRDVWITAAVRCAPPDNKPTPAERDRCVRRFARPELALLRSADVLVCLGAFAWDAALRTLAPDGVPPRPKPKFAHGAETHIGAHTLIGCFHVSQQNTFTGRLTEPMIDAAFLRARALAGLAGA